MKRYTPAQTYALALFNNYKIEVGMETFAGLHKRTVNTLNQYDLIAVEGQRKPRWVLTESGRREIERLVAEGQLEKEPEQPREPQNEVEKAAALLLRRNAFLVIYCAERGWDKDKLTVEQVREIRQQDGWKNA